MTLTSAIAVLLCAVKKVIKYVYTPANVDQVIATSITATFTMFNDSGHSCVPTVLFATAAWKKNKRFEVRGMLLNKLSGGKVLLLLLLVLVAVLKDTVLIVVDQN